MTLAALGRQTLADDRFEVIVVVDRADDGAAARIGGQDRPFRLTALHSGGVGAAGARNAGAEVARGEFLVFLDDDIEAAPDLLRCHLEALSKTEDGVSIGQSRHVPGPGYASQASGAWWSATFEAMRDPGYRFGFKDVMSGNLGLRRTLFETVGGFDARLKCREDHELGLRLIKAGARLHYVETALGDHHEGATQARALARARSEAVADIEVMRHHPEIARHLRVANLAADATGAKLLRRVLYHAPRAGKFGQGLAIRLCRLFETLRLRSLWGRLNHAVRLYAYYDALARAFGDEAAMHAALRAADDRARAVPPAILRIDVTRGMDPAAAVLPEGAPDGIAVVAFDRYISELPPWPGHEALRQVHVCDFLDRTRPTWAPIALAAASVPEVTGTEAPPGPGVGLTVFDLATGGLGPTSPGRTRVLVRDGRHCLGTVDLADGADRRAIGRAIVADRALSARIAARRLVASVPAAADRAPVSVVICTRDRTDNLARCLRAIEALDPPPAEILIVDNAPTGNATRDLVAGWPGLRYVREDKPGLDNARNRGIAEAVSPIIAFTDDDTWPDPHWIDAIQDAFLDPTIDAMTGLVMPMSLDTPARRYFEDIYGGMGKGFDRIVFDPSRMASAARLWASRAGVGANMAFRRSLLERIGPFDPALDVGTATRGGGDVEMFFRTLAAGHRLVYAPDALVWHEHRGEWEALRRQLEDNGSGFAAYLATAAGGPYEGALGVLRFAVFSWIWPWLIRRLVWPGAHRRDLVWAECRGAVMGLFRLRKARKVAGRLATEAAKGDRR